MDAVQTAGLGPKLSRPRRHVELGELMQPYDTVLPSSKLRQATMLDVKAKIWIAFTSHIRYRAASGVEVTPRAQDRRELALIPWLRARDRIPVASRMS